MVAVVYHATEFCIDIGPAASSGPAARFVERDWPPRQNQGYRGGKTRQAGAHDVRSGHGCHR